MGFIVSSGDKRNMLLGIYLRFEENMVWDIQIMRTMLMRKWRNASFSRTLRMKNRSTSSSWLVYLSISFSRL